MASLASLAGPASFTSGWHRRLAPSLVGGAARLVATTGVVVILALARILIGAFRQWQSRSLARQKAAATQLLYGLARLLTGHNANCFPGIFG